MARVRRGTGREALVSATADVLMAGGDVQVKEVASAAGVSHTLIYRHFPEGGKEELVAEAYAEIFRGLAREDIDQMFDAIHESGGDVRGELRQVARRIFDPRRDARRAARLEALAQIRLNPYVGSRIEDMRKELIQYATERIMDLKVGMAPATARAVSMVTQAIPLGITALAGVRLAKADRESVADMWADTIVMLLGLESRDAPPVGAGRRQSPRSGLN